MRLKLHGSMIAMAMAVMAAIALAEDGPTSEMGIAEIVAALDSSDLSGNELRSMGSYKRLDIVDLSKLEEDADFELLEKALTRTDDGWAIVQSAVVANEKILQELRRRSVSIQRISAASVADNVITIYIR